MSDRFAIYSNRPGATDIKIHRIGCTAYKRRKPGAPNSDWHTAPDLKAARATAKDLALRHKRRRMIYRDCKWCKPSAA